MGDKESSPEHLKKYFRPGAGKRLPKPPLQHEVMGHFFGGFTDEMGLKSGRLRDIPFTHESLGHALSNFRQEAENKTSTDFKPETKP